MKKNTRLGILVGHGSGMTIDINISNGGYPTDLLTEDLTFGFIISANNIPIKLLPALEIADVPSKFTIFIQQKSVWFWNYLGYIECYKKMRKQGHSIFQLAPLLLQGIGAGAYWFFSALFIVVPFVISLILGSFWIALITLISTFIFCIIPQYILLCKMPEILHQQGFSQISESVKKISFMQILLPLLLIVLTDSVGAWIATVKYVKYLFTRKLPKKNKTDD